MATVPETLAPSIDPVPPPPDPIAEAMARIANRTPEEIEAAREKAFAASRPPDPLPSGKTWIDMVVGQWPGDETDEEIEEWLRKRKGG